MRLLLVLLFVVMTAPAPAASAQHLPPRQVVERFVEAYNRHDVEGMFALVHPQVQWLSIAADSVRVETSGAAAMRESITRYFAAVPSSRSSIEALLVAGSFVSVWERAHWQSGSGARTQSSLSVYELEEGRIRRIWYYPVQP